MQAAETEEKLTCCICFEPVKTRGALNSCKHAFCFDCIYEWSKASNTCPCCKLRFTSLVKEVIVPPEPEPGKRTKPERKKTIRIPHRDLKPTHDDFDPSMWQDDEYSDDDEWIVDDDVGEQQVLLQLVREMARNYGRVHAFRQDLPPTIDLTGIDEDVEMNAAIHETEELPEVRTTRSSSLARRRRHGRHRATPLSVRRRSRGEQTATRGIETEPEVVGSSQEDELAIAPVDNVATTALQRPYRTRGQVRAQQQREAANMPHVLTRSRRAQLASLEDQAEPEFVSLSSDEEI